MQSVKTWTTFLTILLFFFISKTPVFAGDVVINEFLVDPDAQQWVELYNKGTEVVNISGWFIDDNGGTQKFTIPSGTNINPSEFKTLESSFFNLNRTSADSINLLNGITLEDSYSYAVGPGVNNSYGRDIDGVGNWVIFNSPTKGSTNNASTPVPTATPTFAPSATPTNTPTPTKTPTPTPTTKPTSTPKIPTPTKIPTSTPIKSGPTASPILIANNVQESTQEAIPTSILGESTESAVNNISSTSNSEVKMSPSAKETKVLGNSENNLPKILIGIGIIFLTVCGILAFRSYTKSKKESELL